MPLTDSIEKASTAERTAGPIAAFSNSYARLPEHFFARLSPTPVARPRLIIFNEFAETLLPLLDPNPERGVELANEAISAFMSRFQEHWLAGMRDKSDSRAMKKAISSLSANCSKQCMKTPRTLH